MDLVISDSVQHALKNNEPVVSLESTVITHGLPYPQNLELAESMEDIIRHAGCVPATVALIDGKVKVGLASAELKEIAMCKDAVKVSRRDFGFALANRRIGGTTVAGTIYISALAGIKVFATGGIGGVHRGSQFDISADLLELAHTPIIVVCAGAKSILDIPNTLEYLETQGVTVIGYQTDTFPAFFTRSSGVNVPFRIDSATEIARIAQAQWNLGLNNSILVGNPIPAEHELADIQAEEAIKLAVKEAEESGISGSKLTPFLLSRVSSLTESASLLANLTLLKNNAKLAAEISKQLLI